MTTVQSFLLDIYDWLLAAHVLSFIAWMAGIFYLPRLFVYHAERGSPGTEIGETFKVMELKLFRLIMNPAMIATWLFGILLVSANGLAWLGASPWLHAKLVLVAAMTWFHHWCGTTRKRFARDENARSGRHFRLMNEVPTLLLVGIVVLAIVQPF
ncbi:MAG: protoporphyrinogen oxidase HemJ [Paracoccaceae bacterium]